MTAAHPFPKPVLVVGNFLSAHGTGSRQVCEDLVERLRAAGARVVATSDRQQRLARVGDMLATTWSRRHDYAAAQVDVFSGNSFLWAEAVCFVLRRAGKPYVLTLHGGNLPGFLGHHPRRARALLGSAASVTVPSGFLFEQLREFRPDLRVVPNGLDLDVYPFRLRQRADPRLVWLRAFHRIYNPMLAVRVLSLLTDEFPGITLDMTGPDKGDGSLDATREAARRLGVEDRIRFHGAVTKSAVPRALACGDIYLSTTDHDNAPVSVIEAMACGLCVVTTDAGGIPHLVDSGSDALMVPCGGAQEMAAAIARILREPRLAETLSANGRKKAAERDWQQVLPRWASLFSEITP